VANIIIQHEPLIGAAGLRLSFAFNRELCDRYPHLVLGNDPNGLEASGGDFFVRYVEGEPVACGAFRTEIDGAAEFKRMFVAAEFRKHGFGRAMLDHLEGEAFAAGFTRAILETGIHQPEAIGLYISSGWKGIEPFGPNAGDPLSLCFGKRLRTGSGESNA
jgi:GNAT superfamily N-acetyltransferase